MKAVLSRREDRREGGANRAFVRRRWQQARISKNGTPVARPVRKATGLSESCRSEMAGLPKYACIGNAVR